MCNSWFFFFLKALAANGADLNDKDNRGKFDFAIIAPFKWHWACYICWDSWSVSVLWLFVAGCTAAHLAAAHGNSYCLQSILRHGVVSYLEDITLCQTFLIRRPACYVEAQGQPNISWNLHIANCCSSTFENHFRLSENFKVGSWTVLNALITNMQYLRCCSVKKYLVVIPN